MSERPVVIKRGAELISEAERDIISAIRDAIGTEPEEVIDFIFAENSELPNTWPELMAKFYAKMDSMVVVLDQAVTFARQRTDADAVGRIVRALEEAMQEIEGALDE
jgi:hypothetical protein